MDDERILVQVTDRVMEITLNRPDRLNAWTPGMGHELIAALDAADADDGVRAVIVTGAGAGSAPGPTWPAAATRLITAVAPAPAPALAQPRTAMACHATAVGS